MTAKLSTILLEVSDVESALRFYEAIPHIRIDKELLPSYATVIFDNIRLVLSSASLKHGMKLEFTTNEIDATQGQLHHNGFTPGNFIERTRGLYKERYFLTKDVDKRTVTVVTPKY